MSQNTSPAVMQQRREPTDSLDDFPTPPWATRALCVALIAAGVPLHLLTAWEPACNRGYMARVLGEYFDQVRATDIHDYGWSGQEAQGDFLLDQSGMGGVAGIDGVDWVITNPPFRLAADFIARGRVVAREGVAVLVRTSFLEGAGRWRALFRDNPPALVFQFVERVVMHEGKLPNPNVAVPTWSKKRQEWVMRKPSTATSYCWLVWRAGANLCETRWIGPSRAELERIGDYPEETAA